MARLNSIVLIVSFALALVAFWQRDELPARLNIQADLAGEPRQTKTGRQPFSANVNGVEYRIDPEYDYELTGLVVSYRHHDHERSRLHRRANDHLNMLDICVVWGENASSSALYEMKFSSGIFTCFFEADDWDVWHAFKPHELSNNHLLSDDEAIRRKVLDISVGDQVRMRGSLVRYSSEPGNERGTSTTRFDSGNGACETVYVDEFQVIEPALSPWRMTSKIAPAVFLLSLATYFFLPYRPHRR